MKLLDLKINLISANDKGDLLLNYNTTISADTMESTFENLEAIYIKDLNYIVELERPKGMRTDTIKKALMNYITQQDIASYKEREENIK